jgi:CrcB protein
VTRFLIVCGAGGLGCGLRYLVSQWANREEFPYGTLIVNVLGSLVMTLVLELSLRMTEFPAELRLAITTGFLGGFTTYSAFNYETSTLALDGNWTRAVANLGITLAGCFAAGLLGLAIARKLA